MKKIYMLFTFVFVSLFCLTLIGCIDDPIDSIYNPDKDKGATPAISSISPSGLAYSSFDEIVIRGENFSPVLEDNIVYFNTTRVPVEFASSTELRLTAPNLPGDVSVKIAVMGAQLFSNTIDYKLLPAFIDMGDYGPVDAFFAIESDAVGNLYVNVSLGTNGRVDKIDADGEVTQYAELAGFGSANVMRFAPDGTLWFTRNGPILAKVAPGGGRSSNFTPISGYQVYDLDFDKYGNMWGVGYHATVASRRIFKMKDSTVTGDYPVNARFRACKVFNDYLYVAGLDGADGDRVKIWRAPIDGDANLGALELYYDWSSSNFSGAINAITIAADGTLYVANNGPDEETIVAITPNKVAAPLYPGQLMSNTYNLFWGTGEDIKYTYVSRRVVSTGGNENNKIIKMYMGKDGAPYYGRN